MLGVSAAPVQRAFCARSHLCALAYIFRSPWRRSGALFRLTWAPGLAFGSLRALGLDFRPLQVAFATIGPIKLSIDWTTVFQCFFNALSIDRVLAFRSLCSSFWALALRQTILRNLDETLAMRRKIDVWDESRARPATTVSNQKTVDRLAKRYQKQRTEKQKKRCARTSKKRKKSLKISPEIAVAWTCE